MYAWITLEVIQGHAFWDRWKADEGLRKSAYYCIIIWALYSRKCRKKSLSISVFENPTVIRHPTFREPLQIFSQALYFYTVSTKKLHPCIRCHNSGKQRRILTKFYDSTATLNCKQVTKFQQNRSTFATATASLVSLKSISVHYRHRRDWLSSVRPCEWQDVSTPKVCV